MVSSSLVQIPLPRKGTETVLACAFAVVAGRFKFHYPARGRKLSAFDLIVTVTPPVQIPLPRKGTETWCLRCAAVDPEVQIPLPRKGTETRSHCEAQSFQQVQIPLPRKGTETHGWSFDDHFRVCSNSITPQGDGNNKIIIPGDQCRDGVQIPLPRKGTETITRRVSIFDDARWFKFHYPARGRKPIIHTTASVVTRTGSNSITPQGDGNNRAFLRKK